MKNLFVDLSEANVTTCTNYCYSQLGRSFFTGFNNIYALHGYSVYATYTVYIACLRRATIGHCRACNRLVRSSTTISI